MKILKVKEYKMDFSVLKSYTEEILYLVESEDSIVAELMTKCGNRKTAGKKLALILNYVFSYKVKKVSVEPVQNAYHASVSINRYDIEEAVGLDNNEKIIAFYNEVAKRISAFNEAIEAAEKVEIKEEATEKITEEAVEEVKEENSDNIGNDNTGNDNIGNGNTGDDNRGNENTGHRNQGNYNTGNANIGKCNTGYANIGNGNTGSYNTGSYNTGDYNAGSANTGSYNTGNYNAGSRNVGGFNTGNHNQGNYNTGNGNIGDNNAGDFNKCSFSVGCFNTEPEKIRLFNMPSNWTMLDWQDSRACYLLNNMLGNGKTHQNWWNNLPAKDKKEIKSIPNFDKDIFKEITGIDIDGKGSNEK